MEKFINKILYPVIAIVLANLFLLVLGKLINNNWESLYHSIPNWVLWVLFGLLVFWLIVVLVRKRIKKLNTRGGSSFFLLGTPTYGYRVLGILDYKKVKWQILYPKDSPFELNPSLINPDGITIKSTPYCPICKDMELNERRNFWGRYIWSCIRCGFKAKNREDAFYESENNALKLAKSEVIRHLQDE